METSTGSKLCLWVKSEIFVNGILAMPPNPRLSLHYIKKLVSYARAKGGYPEMTYSIWRHVAVNKLLLSEDIAWLYFCVYDLINPNPERTTEYKSYHNATGPEMLTDLKCSKKVNLYRFALLLYMQQMNLISLRSSLISADQEWPSTRSQAMDSSSAISSAQTAKHMDEHAQMTFVMNNLTEMMELLMEPDTYNGGAADQRLTMESVESLSLFFDGFCDDKRILLPLDKLLISQQEIQIKAGFSKMTRSYSLRQLSGWIKSGLSQNPFGVTSCISSGRRLSWVIDETDDRATSGVKRGKLATNAHLVTRQNSKGNKLIIMSQVCKETLAKMSSTLESATVKIHRCHQSYLYLLSPLRSVSIEKCRDTTIVLGPVQCHVQMSHCHNVTLISVSHTLSLSYCTSCTVHCSTPTRPLLFTHNENVTLAPYNTSYKQLYNQLNLVNLTMEPNLWNNPFYLGPDHHDSADLVWQLMKPSDFYIFTIPFDIQTAGIDDVTAGTDDVTESISEFQSGIPSGLPSNYTKSLRQRERKIEDWQKTVKSAGLNKEKRRQFQQLVEVRFQAWLVESGYKTELDGLANLHKRDKKKQ